MTQHAHPHGPHPSVTGDLLGQLISLVCLVHCVATPVVLVAAPAMAGFLGGWHPVLLVGVVGAAGWAFVPGYRYHRSKAVLALAVLGVALLATGVTAFHEHLVAETAISITGAVLMLTAHWKNRRLSKRCPA